MENHIKKRFYLLRVEQDLFNIWCLNRTFGGLFNLRRRSIIQIFASEEAAWQQLTEIEYQKRQRSYVYADLKNAEYFKLRPQNLSEIIIQQPKLETLKPVVGREKLVNPLQMELAF